MADYVKIQNYSKNGNLGISRKVFETIALEATNRVQGVSVSKSKKIKSFTLSKPVEVSFRNDGKVEVKISIDLQKGIAAKTICAKIQEEVASSLLAYTESVPFDITIKVASIK